MNTQLLCLFTTKEDLDKSYSFIIENYVLTNPNIFILENRLRPNDMFITFNIERGAGAIESEWKTILVHRKKQSNTIYTINALNEVVKSKTGGQVDNTFIIDWEEFQNCILTTSQLGYKKIPTKVYKSIRIENFEL
jgi:hypothetical protein